MSQQLLGSYFPAKKGRFKSKMAAGGRINSVGDAFQRMTDQVEQDSDQVDQGTDPVGQ